MTYDIKNWIKIKYQSSRSRFIFYTFGLPCLFFMVPILWSYQVFFSIMISIPLIAISIALLPRALKKKSFYSYFLKIGFIFMIVYVSLVPNPMIWGQQIYRHLNHREILTPNEPMVQALNNSENLWGYISDHYSGATPETLFTWSIPDQARRIYYYIDSLIDYEYDIDNNHVFNYVATPKEVLTTGKDDCQGISCVLVSFLLFLGYDAYICETPFHWYVRVYYDETYYDVYRHSGNTDPLLIFNEDEVIYPGNLMWTIETIFSYDYIPRKYAEIVNGSNGVLNLSVISSSLPVTNIPLWGMWMLIFGVLFLLGILVTIFLNIPNFTETPFRGKILSALSFGSIMFLGSIGILFIPFNLYLYYLIICLFSALIATDSIGYYFERQQNRK